MNFKKLQGEPGAEERSYKIPLGERVKFNNYELDGSQTVDDHLNTLRKLASTCDFGDQVESRIIEKILTKYNDPEIIAVVNEEHNLERLMELVRIKEKIKWQLETPGSHHEARNATESPTWQKVVTKEEIDIIVDSSLKDGKSLNEIETLLERHFHRQLSQDDRNYVEGKYTEILIELWLDEVSENAMCHGNNPHDVIGVLDSIKSIDSFQGCFSLGHNLPYNSLMKELFKHRKSMIEEKKCVLKFKSTFITFTLQKSTYLQHEIHFHRTFVNTMKKSKYVHEICNELHVNVFLKSEDEAVGFRKLLQNIINSHDSNKCLDDLKTASQAIVDQDKHYFVRYIKHSIEAYLTPTIWTERILDGRRLLEVVGEHIVISEVLEHIERTQVFCEIEEVRFVKAGVIHIDENFNSKLWHGKNVVVFADTVIVSKDRIIIWDVSGQDAKYEEKKPAGTGINGVGLDGAEGEPGESGGNVFLICDEIQNAPNLKIVSNGGKGGQGQGGGIGMDGKDGDYINGIDFKKNFPPVSKFFDNSKRENLKKTKLHVMDYLQSAKFSVMGKLVSVSLDEFHDLLEKCIENLDDFYFETKTKKGCRVLFSFYYGPPLFTFCQSFLLHKGSDAETGKDGGKGGLGGEGGFAGEVRVVMNGSHTLGGIAICTSKGEDGKHGESGMCGKPGKSGLDCAYIDAVNMRSPKYYLTQENDSQRLTVEYHSGKASERVYNSHNGQYAEIKKVQKEYNKICKMQNLSTKKQLSHIQYKMQGNRKKTISPQSIMDEYKQETSEIDCLKLDTIEKRIRQMYEEIANEEMLQNEQITKETKITRKVDFHHNKCFGDGFRTILGVTNHNGSSNSSIADKFPKTACSTSTDDCNLNNLLQIKLNWQELRSLWNSIQTRGESTEKVNLLLNSKYHLAVLDHLEQTLIKSNNSMQSRNSLVPKLTGSVECSLKISNEHTSFSEVESYLCNDSKDRRFEIIQKLKDSASDLQFCTNIFNIYIDDSGEFDNCEKFLSDSHLQAYKKHYNWFKLKKTKSMHNKIIPLLNGMTGNQETCKKLVKAITEQNIHLKVDVEHLIRGDTLLNILYEKYVEEVNKPFVWKSILLSQKALSEKLEIGFKFAINHKGSSSVFYREVVARLFKTNILLYTENECNQMVLVHNHNPSADEVTCILIRGNRCFKLETDEGLSKVIRTHEEKGQMCSRIQLHIDSIQGQETFKEECDKLISKSPFLVDEVSKSAEIRIKINHMLMEDENIQSIANVFERDEDKKLVRFRLTMLKHDYVGYQNFLYYIALHMKTEGNQLSVKELCCVINFLLKSVVDSLYKTNVVSWIIAAHNQMDWVIEFLLFKLELCFKQPLEDGVRNTWKEQLRDSNRETCLLLFEKLSTDQSLVKIENVEEVILLISQVQNHYIGLSQLCLNEWKYFLKDTFWGNQMKRTGNWSEEELKIASFHLVTLENSVGKELCCEFLKVINSLSNSMNSENDKFMVLNTLELLKKNETMFNSNILRLLSNTDIHKWEEVVQKESFSSGEERSLNELSELITMNCNTSEHIRTNINEIVKSVQKTNVLTAFLKSIMDKKSKLKDWIYKLLGIFKGRSIPLLAKEKPFQSNDIGVEMSKTLQNMQKALMEHQPACSSEVQTSSDFLLSSLDEIVLAAICASIYLTDNKTLRNTQLLAIVTLLKTSEKVLGQVSTGEGKSFIIISVAIMKALSGSKVDIITSSHVLAERDAKNAQHLCTMFGIEVGHNCSEHIEERKEIYSKCCVVYGELSHFQRDFLLHRAYDKNIIGDRKCQTILIDEVDSMLLDKANNVLYLSHDIPGLDKLEPLFVFIWKCLNVSKDLLDVDQLKENILQEMYDLIKKEDVRNLDTSLEENHIRQTWTHLVKGGVIDSNGKVLIEQLDHLKLDNLAKNCIHGDHIKYLLKKVIKREKEFEIPNYLKNFVEDHIDKWIDSAIDAINLKNNVDYVIDVDRSENSTDRNPNIIIVDRDTGTDLVSSQWDQGLHQFLQLKHGCRLSPLTFKAVFISNVSYLKMYTTLFGLTGTLGSKIDRDLLKEIYGVEFVTIPTAKAKKFTEEMPILCNTLDDWTTNICRKAYEVTNTRSALIICDSVSDVSTLNTSFEVFAVKNKLPRRNIQTYTRDYEEFRAESDKGTLHVGEIIISTNLAGRGTDIKLSDELIKNGGLHVCLSFLPSNSRIEEQAFGRSARNGQAGSGQLIFQEFGLSNISKIIDLKKERDVNEISRISEVKKHYETKIKPEEELFLKFLDEYSSLRGLKHDDEVKEILLMTILDQWAFWLEKNSTYSGISLSISDLVESISKLHAKDFGTWTRQIQDPFQLTKLGLFYLKQKDNEKALHLFNRVIKSEPAFSEGAYYYRACAETSEKEIQLKDLINQMKTVEKKLKNRIESSIKSAHFIDYLKNCNSRNVLQIDSYKQQQQIVSNTYEIFLESVWNITGRPVTPEQFSVLNIKCQPNIENEMVGSVIFNDLTERGIIKHQVKDNVSERELNFTSEYGIHPESMKEVLDRWTKHCPRTEEFILQDLKQRIVLSTRERFWKDLVAVGILENEEKFVIVNHEKLKKIDPSLADYIKSLAVEMNPPAKNRVSLYLPEEIGIQEENFEQRHSLFIKNVLKDKLGKAKLHFFKRENIMIFNKQASFSSLLMKTVALNHFDNIKNEDFLKLEVSHATASSIIDDLIKKKIIHERKNSNPPQYKLLINFEDIDGVELGKHKTYSSDVKSLLSHCFAFRIAVQKLQHVIPLCEGNYSKLCLPLQTNLYRRFFYELKEQGVIEQTINSEELKSGDHWSIYSSSMNKHCYINVFAKLYGWEKSEQIVDDLISKEWLKKTNFVCKVKENQDFLNRFLQTTYSINYKCKKQEEIDTKILIGKPLSEGIINDSKTIQQILLCHLTISENIRSIKGILEHLADAKCKVETPSLSLTPLETVMTESKMPTSELGVFIQNGFSHVISLEEKKFTKRMKKNTAIVSVLALIEIAVGVSLQFWFLGNPIGIYFLSQGIDDLIFVTSCVFSGYFSWRSYASNKLISLVTASLSCLKAFNSTFATKSAGLSVTTMKEKCLGFVSNVKSSVKNLFGSVASHELTKTEIATQLCKRVVVHATEGVALGITFAVVDGVMQKQVENFEEALTTLVHSDIDSIVTNHYAFENAEELYSKLGKAKADDIIKKSLDKIHHDYLVKLEQNFDSINLGPIKTLIERTISKKFNNKQPGLSSLDQIELAFGSVTTLCKSASHFHEITSTLVHSILKDIEQEIQKELIKVSELQYRQTIDHSELFGFRNEVLNKMQCCIKSVFSEHIRKKVLLPISQLVGTCIEKFSIRTITKVRKSFLNDEEINTLNGNKISSFQKRSKVKNEIKEYDFFSAEFDEITCEVLKTRKNKSVLRYKISQNAPMDFLYCMELCCKVIPFALKQEGLRVPAFRIEVEKNGATHDFSIGDVRGECTTLKIAPNSDLLSNLKNNKILVEDVFNFLFNSCLEYNPEFKGLTATILREMAVKAIDSFCNSQPSGCSVNEINQLFDQGRVFEDPAYNEVSHVNTECEKKTPYQHSHFGGGWVFSPSVDVDLREKDSVTNLANVHKFVNKGFETALGKINAHIHKIQSVLSCFNLVIDDFAATKHQLAPPPPEMSELFYCYTVQYELDVPVLLKDCNSLVDFNIILRLENGKLLKKPQFKSPLGPHVLYEMNPVNNAKFLNKGLKGHILLQIDCTTISYSVNDCQVAGELILPSLLPKQKTERKNPVERKNVPKRESKNLVLRKMEGESPLCDVETTVLGDNVPKSETGKLLPSEVGVEASVCRVEHRQVLKESNVIIIGDSLFKYINQYIMMTKCDFGIFPHLRPNKFQSKIMPFLSDHQGIRCVVFLLGNDIIKTNISEQHITSCIFKLVRNVQENIANVKVVMCTMTFVKQPAEKYYGKIVNANNILKDFCVRENLGLVDTNRIICPQDLGRDGIHLNRSGYYKLGKHLSEVCQDIIN